MKKLLLILTVFATLTVKAQSPNSNTGVNVATVNIILNDLQSIIVNSSQRTIDLIYNSKESYENGASSMQIEHLEAFSTQNYRISSAVWQENLITQNDIYLNGILQTRLFTELFQGNAGTGVYDVEYSAKGNNDYIDKNKTTYTTQVIYTIAPR